MKKPNIIIRNDDGERYILQPDGNYANEKMLEMGSIMRFPFSSFNKKFFTFINVDGITEGITEDKKVG